MSSIRKELNELAIKMGAPVVGENISEQIRAINVHLGGSSHGANIGQRIDEFSKVVNSNNSGSNVGPFRYRFYGVNESRIDELIKEG